MLAYGGGLFYGVQKFFKEIEEKLSEDAKFEIAVWLVGVRPSGLAGAWPETFLHAFDRVFGTVHPSWRGLRRSYLITVVCYLVGMTYFMLVSDLKAFFMDSGSLTPAESDIFNALPLWVVKLGVILQMPFYAAVMAIPEYAALVVTRRAIASSRTYLLLVRNVSCAIAAFLCVVNVLTISGLILARLMMGAKGWREITRGASWSWFPSLRDMFFFFPLFFGVVWLILYGVSAFVLKGARRYDTGFDWFNRKFDIEKHPLQSIGLVAGSIAAMLYWVASLVHHFA